MFLESDLLPISALQHLLFCPRQCALIHIERLWADNRWTAEGRVLHERAHTPKIERRPGVRMARGMSLRSLALGIFGQADIVEFDSSGAALPVEYKRGRPKKGNEDRVQLCAQALCLEEMLGQSIPTGAIFYGAIRRRDVVALDAELRARTIDAIARLHEMLDGGITPSARLEKKCQRCSLLHLCMPAALEGHELASRYLRRQLAAVAGSDGPHSD
jgi:CRISPR-associated exonuclease Cas4